MALYVVRHEHQPEACPGRDPAMGQMLLQHLSPLNAQSYGVHTAGEAVVRGEHTLMMIVDATDEARLREFLQPFSQAGRVDVLPAASCDEVVAQGGCAAVV